ncbi:MAG: trypsin-like peptidase domain-containing protein [Planctomycetales bacterium]|nr:trypsin-like peptidase domain-containing protein [Planctomycetales bacterium]
MQLVITTALLVIACQTAVAHPAACRITNRQGAVESAGSGTLVDVTDDGAAGLVLACAHLFSDGAGEVVVAFPGGGRHGALVVDIDRQADLAALEIAKPRVAPAAIAPAEEAVELAAATQFRACGFGGDGRLQCTTGRFLGQAGDAQRVSWKFAGAVRSGDSGGGVFDSQGRLVAVAWGATDGVTYASGGGPLRRFLQRVLGRRTERVLARRPVRLAPAADCPNGMCPLVPRGNAGSAPRVETDPAGNGHAAGAVGAGALVGRGVDERESTPPASACDCGDALAALGTRVHTLEQDTQTFARREQLDEFARADEVAQLAAEGRDERSSLAERIASLASGAKLGRAAGAAAAGALGVAGPAGWAIIAAGTIGGWWLGQRWRKRAKRKQSSSSRAPRASTLAPEATAAAAGTFPENDDANAAETTVNVQQPIERDDREARQLLRLSQLEGRDPLQDAVAGRLALDRLDAIADGDDDPPHRTWADELRRELRERFNEVAPTKFQVKAEGGGRKAEGTTP